MTAHRAETGDWLLLRADARLALARALHAAGDPAAAARDHDRAKGHPRSGRPPLGSVHQGPPTRAVLG